MKEGVERTEEGKEDRGEGGRKTLGWVELQ